jgi:tetratricopeptide (TPR) repeat protein
MDCRKWFVLVAGLLLSSTGCITEQKNALSDRTMTTVWTPLSMLQKETKRTPQVKTCLEGGQMLEKQALADHLNAMEREELLDRARKAYQQALDIEPGNPQAQIRLAHIYVQLSRFDKALATFDRAIKQHPKNAEVWAGLGQCYFEQHSFTKAADAYRKALDHDPDERTYAKHLALNLALAGQEQESLQVLTKLYGGETQAHYKFAIMMKQLNRPEEARRHLEITLQRDPLFRPAEQLLAQMTPKAVPPDLTQQAASANVAPPGQAQEAVSTNFAVANNVDSPQRSGATVNIGFIAD